MVIGHLIGAVTTDLNRRIRDEVPCRATAAIATMTA
jgi:hypothetical protein